jgi:hypothetical protein
MPEEANRHSLMSLERRTQYPDPEIQRGDYDEMKSKSTSRYSPGYHP